MEYLDFYKNYKSKIEPIIAISVLILLVILAIQLYNDNQLKKEISKNCGWETEDYLCFCEYKKIGEVQNKIKYGNFPVLNINNFTIENDSLDN